MTRPEEVEAVKEMEEAKTGEDMVRSWASHTSQMNAEAGVHRLKLWIDGRPDMIEASHRLYVDIVTRGVLDLKTRELCFLAMALQESKLEIAVEHCQKAKAAGATEDEIMEVAAIVCCGAGKRSAARSSIIMTEAFEKL